MVWYRMVWYGMGYGMVNGIWYKDKDKEALFNVAYLKQIT